MNEMRKKDLEGYAFIRNRLVHTGVTPSLREIAREIGYISPRSVQLMLLRLEKEGLLRYKDGVMTFLHKKSLAAEHTVEVPLIGSVACGAPMLAEQEPEALIRVSTRIAHPGSTYFLLHARGTSMNKSGINDGDLVLVRQQSTAEEGERVVALIDDNATIKHFYREGDVVILRPNSTDKKHEPIVLSDEFIIQGTVVAVLPNI